MPVDLLFRPVYLWTESHIFNNADAILSFMALNGLVANPKKTIFMLLNHKNRIATNAPISVRVGTNLIVQGMQPH